MTAAPPETPWPEIRFKFSLDPFMQPLNAGSYGATPISVIDAQRAHNQRMLADPTTWFVETLPPLVDAGHAALAGHLDVEPETLALGNNATELLQTALWSMVLPQGTKAPVLKAGDHLVLTDHAYTTVAAHAHRVCSSVGAVLDVVNVPLQASDEQVTDAILAQVTRRTRVVVLDAVTSNSARTLPVDTLVPELHSRGIITIVDAAHVPGMFPVALPALQADVWVGNVHKWLFGAPGSAGMYVSPEFRERIGPMYTNFRFDEGFPHRFHQGASRDYSPWLVIPEALAFAEQLGPDRIREHNLALAKYGQQVVAEALDTLDDAPPVTTFMALVPLPDAWAIADEPAALQLRDRIRHELNTTVNVVTWAGQGYVRLSAHVHNRPDDYLRFAKALPGLVPIGTDDP